jgi:hypothetical protein
MGLMEINIGTLEPDQFNDYIVQLNEFIQNSKSDKDKKNAYLKTAIAHVYSRNPSIQYDQALINFNEYLKLEPEQDKKDEILSWINLLEQLRILMSRLKDEQEKIVLLKEKNQSLTQQASNQAKTIRQLENKIKRLDALYFKIEKKKKKNNKKSTQ